MKSVFPEFYKEPDFYIKLWQTGIFVPDACAILRIYQYAPESSKHLLDILTELGNNARLWIPYQFVYEYHKNLDSVLGNIDSQYSEAKSELQSAFNFTKSLNKVKNLIIESGFKVDESDAENLDEILTVEARRVHEDIERKLNVFKDSHTVRLKDGDLKNTIAQLFDKIHGSRPLKTELERLYQAAESRIGWNHPLLSTKNMKKGKPEGFGDYIAWEQIKDWARDPDREIPIVLVSDDGDWFDDNGKPHPFLVREMYEECGVQFFVYKTRDFRKWAEEHLEIQASAVVEKEDEIREKYVHRQLQMSDADVMNELLLRGRLDRSLWSIADKMIKEGASPRFVDYWIATHDHSHGFMPDESQSIIAARMSAHGASPNFIDYWVAKHGHSLGIIPDESQCIIAAQMSAHGASPNFIDYWVAKHGHSLGIMPDESQCIIAARMSAHGASPNFIDYWVAKHGHSLGIIPDESQCIIAARMDAHSASPDFIDYWIDKYGHSLGFVHDESHFITAARMSAHGASPDFIDYWIDKYGHSLGFVHDESHFITAARMSAHGASPDFIDYWIDKHFLSLSFMHDELQSIIAAQMSSHGASPGFIEYWIDKHGHSLDFIRDKSQIIRAAQMDAQGDSIALIEDSIAK